MKPVNFKHSNKTLQPSGATYSENVTGVEPLHIFTDGEQCVSCSPRIASDGNATGFQFVPPFDVAHIAGDNPIDEGNTVRRHVVAL